LSCGSHYDHSDVNYDIEVEKMVIDFGDTLVSPIFTSFSIQSSYENSSFIHTFLDRSRNLIITNIETGEFIKKININADGGPNSTSGGILDFFPVSDSTFLIQSFPFFYFINQNGDVIKRHNLEDKMNKLFGDMYADNLYLSGVMSHSVKINKNKFVLQVFRGDINLIDNYPEYPLFITVKIDNELNIDLLPMEIYFPSKFKLEKTNSYAQNEKASYSVQNGYIIYGFSFSSSVFMYNLETGLTSCLDLEIDNGTNFSPPDDNHPYSISNKLFTAFGMPIVDFDSKLIYRFHTDVNHEDPMESENFLAIFDFEGKKLIESSLGKNRDRILVRPFLFNGHLYVKPPFPSSENEYLEFYKFKLVKR